MQKETSRTPKNITDMNYSEFVGFIKERNRPSGGIRTVHTVAVNSFMDPSKHMLEIGSNTGFTSVNMSLLSGCKVTGIDPNKASVTEARKYAATMEAKNVTFKVASALKLPFPDNSFDMVWSSNVTSFISDKGTAISEYLRVLKPGGILVAVPIYYHTPPPASILDQVSRAVGTQINIWDKLFWDKLFLGTAEQTGFHLEKFFERDYQYYDRQQVLGEYIEMLVGKDHLQNLPQAQQFAVADQARHFMTLFNKNLQYAGYSIMLYQVRTAKDEAELFTSYEV